MPDLLVKPELGDHLEDCFKHAYVQFCCGQYRKAYFTFNGMRITIEKEPQND